jgi:hypothetical protein
MNGPITPRQPSHFYDEDGNPCYEVPYADPKKGMRKADLRDARKHGWFPSTTTVLRIIDKPYLNTWIANQAVEACVSLSQEIGRPLSEEDYPEIKERADAISKEAREKGTEIHRAIECVMQDYRDYGWHMGSLVTDRHGLSVELWVALIDLFTKHQLQPRALERSFVTHRWGYGGRTDFEGLGRIRPNSNRDRYCVLDYKTQNTKGTGKFTVYPEVRCQLAAYAMGVGKSTADLGTIFIDTSIEGNVELVYHPDNDVYFQSFINAFKVWKDPILGKNFEPKRRTQ